MSSPLLTVGMAHHSDFDGAWFSIQSLRMHSGFHSDDLQIVVVDNSPLNAHGQQLEQFCGKVKNLKYVPLPENVGTSVPRNRVFEEADAPLVVCLDCHVLVKRDALHKLLTFSSRDSVNMFTGPMLNPDGSVHGTHWNDQWREQMWGTWGLAFECPCGFTQFSLVSDSQALWYVNLQTQQRITGCRACERVFPVVSVWKQQRELLESQGHEFLGENSRPFEIPGMGLGCFAMRKDAWVGFHPDARGFGGEEMWVHEKVRRAGGRVICCPWFAWMHRTERVAGIPYPLRKTHRVRNYILEFQELQMDLAPIHGHFVGGGYLTEFQWERCLAGNVPLAEPAQPDEQKESAPVLSLDSLYQDWLGLDPRGVLIKSLASTVNRVTIIGAMDQRWDVFCLAARPDEVISYTRTQNIAAISGLHDLIRRGETSRSAERRVKRYEPRIGQPAGALPPTEMLVLVAKGVVTPEQITNLSLKLLPLASAVLVIVDDTQTHVLTTDGMVCT